MDVSAYCISLRENQEERFRCQIELLSLPFAVAFHVVDRDPVSGGRGCFSSHLGVLRLGLESGSEYIAVFEDDVYFEGINANTWTDLAQFTDSIRSVDSNWCFCFGYFTASRATPFRDNIISLSKCYCSHAYLVPRRTAEQLVQMAWDGRPYDMHWHDVIDRFFAPNLMIAFQRDHPSSISSDFGAWVMNKVGYRRIAKLCQWWSQVR